MMVYSRALLFCSLILLTSEQSMGQVRDPPTIQVPDSTLHEGLTYSFSCIPPLAAGPLTLYSYVWWTNGQNSITTPTNNYELELTPDVAGGNLTCAYSTSTRSETSSAFVLTAHPLPAPTFIPSDAFQVGIVSQFYNLVCSAPGYLISRITSYSFMKETEMSFFQSTSPSPNFTIIPNYFRVTNLTCAYNISEVESPVSSLVTLAGTAIGSVTAIPSTFLAFYGQEITFSCVIVTAEGTTPPFLGYRFTFRWFDGDGNRHPIPDEVTTNATVSLRMNVTSNLTFSCEASANNDVFIPSSPASVTALEMPKPSIPSTDVYYFSGNTYVFQCQVPLFDHVNYTAFIWKHNGTVVRTHESYLMSFTMPEPPFALSITCQSLVDSIASDESDPLVISVSEMPQPSIEFSPDHGFYIDGTSYTFTCTSTLSRVATEYSFKFVNNTFDRDQPSSTITLLADTAQPYQFTCIVSNFNSSSDPSESLSMVASVLLPPTIQVLDAPSHYLVGTQYALECQSDMETFATQYCLKNSTNEVACQRSKRFNFTAEETEQFLQCNISFIDVFSDYSPGVSVIGSGIVNAFASADTLTPYPGTNVTLTCTVTLISGYDELDVNFSWKEGDTLRAQTKVTTAYVTNSMETSFNCEGTTGRVDVGSNILNITARDLPRPFIEVQSRPADGSYEPGYFYTLLCNSELEDLLSFYNWYRDGQLVEDAHSKNYLAQAMSFTHLYTCTFVVVTEESPESPNLTLSTQSILNVQVESNGPIDTTLTPIFNSVLLLSCEAAIKSTATENPTFNWMQSGIHLGTGQEVTILAYAGYDYSVVCEVTVGDDVKTSKQVNITSREDLPPPAISLTTHQIMQVLPRASYTLRCISTALSLNSSIMWYKDLRQLLCLRDLTLDITRYDPSTHDGQYTCEITVFGMTAISDPTIMEGLAPGKQCQGSNQCTNQGEAFTGVCQDQRCVCSEGYKARFDTCTSA